MSTVEARLVELGRPLPAARAPVGAYVPAVRAGGLVMSSGQLPMAPTGIVATGGVGDGPGLVDVDTAGDCAALAAVNALAAIRSVIADLDSARVVKLTGFVACEPDFAGQPAVVDHASRLIVAAFGERGRHARSAIGVAALPLNSPVEIELTAWVDDDE